MDYSYGYPNPTGVPGQTIALAYGILAIYVFVSLALLIIYVVGVIARWKIFTKAGRPGWSALIPFYSTYVLCEVVGRPGWWFLLLLIPLVNIVISLLIAMDLAKAFNQSQTFGIVALWLLQFVGLSWIGYLILAFGDSRYMPPTQPTTQSAIPDAPDQPQLNVAA